MTLEQEEEFEKIWAHYYGIDGYRSSIKKEDARTFFAAGTKVNKEKS